MGPRPVQVLPKLGSETNRSGGVFGEIARRPERCAIWSDKAAGGATRHRLPLIKGKPSRQLSGTSSPGGRAGVRRRVLWRAHSE